MRPALIALSCVLLAACGPSIAPTAAGSPSASATVSGASPTRVQAPPVVPPTPPGNALPPFVCADAAGGKTGVANSIAARVSEQPGYDRFVLQFDSIIPTFTVKRQAKPLFALAGSGQPVTLAGTSGVLVQVHSATGATTFTGPTDIVNPDYKILLEARQTGDFEGYVSWGLGLRQSTCIRVYVLQEPARLVIDFQTA